MREFVLKLSVFGKLLLAFGLYSKKDRINVLDEAEDGAKLALSMEPPRKFLKASLLTDMRPNMCINERLDLEYGDHYNIVHPKSPILGRCRYDDFVWPKHAYLGSGGYGVVSQATHKPTNRTFAIKSIIEMNPAWHGWIRAEECIQYGLDWPFIVKLYCSMLHDWYAWLVLDLVDGVTLRERLKDGPALKNDAIQRIAAQLIVTLEYLHLNGIVFGDLTSANVMIENVSGDIKLIDFGFALRMNRTEHTEVTPKWEKDSGRVLPDFAPNPINDWYAFGFLLFEMIAAITSEASGEGERKWHSPTKLNEIECAKLLENDAVSCDLIDKFIGNRQKSNWESIWGTTEASRGLIKSHTWFNGFDWNALDGKVARFRHVNEYNKW